ncbi:putative thiol oxidase [Medicago truncatula]|nr:putative thiol oxidase [Medicago truncatula]
MVYKVQKNNYTKTLVSFYKERGTIGNEGTKGAAFEDLMVATNAAVVPVGAASCAFRVFACYWRSQQNNRK